MEVHSGGDQDLNQALLPEEEEDKDDDDSLILEALVLRAVHSWRECCGPFLEM